MVGFEGTVPREQLEEMVLFSIGFQLPPTCKNFILSLGEVAFTWYCVPNTLFPAISLGEVA